MIIDIILKKIKLNLNLIYSKKKQIKIKNDKSIVTKSEMMIQRIVELELKNKLKKNFYLIF